MVSTRSPKPTGVLTRRKSASDLSKGRPKRNVSPKNLDDSVSGLSWREERELKKALYASLQEARRQSKDEKSDDMDFVFHDSIKPQTSFSENIRRELTTSKVWKVDKSSSSLNQDTGKTAVDDKENEQKRTKYHAQRKFAVNSFTVTHQASDSLRSSLNGSASCLASDQKKIHAQRKFAHGSLPSTPSETPSKPKTKVSPVKLFPVRPKTEDFLTYLCFRGKPFLPPHLDLMNVQKEETDSDMMNGKNGTRESSPASSSTMSHNNEDSMDVPDMSTRTPLKKAARASASTPDTARGFSHLRSKVGAKGSTTSRSRHIESSLHRKRLSDSYLSSRGGTKSPSKSDRLSLKRKALATLTAARRSSSNVSLRKSKSTVSEGVLKKGKGKQLCETGNENIIPVTLKESSKLHNQLTKNLTGTGPVNDYLEDSGIYVSTVSLYENDTEKESLATETSTGTVSVENGYMANPNKTDTNIVDNSLIITNTEKDDGLMERKSDLQKNPTSPSLVDSLLIPISSDLEGSLDMSVDLDVSLNLSLDLNDILRTADQGFEEMDINSILGEECSRHNHRSEESHGQVEICDETRSQGHVEINRNIETFMPAFKEPSRSPVDFYIENELNNNENNQKRKFDRREHNYSKVMKAVKFKVKCRRNQDEMRLSSTPFKGLVHCSPSESANCFENERFNTSFEPESSRRSSSSRTDQIRKRRSTSNLPDNKGHSPIKRSRLNMNTRSRSTHDHRSKVKPVSRGAGLETHPKKRFAITSKKVKRTFKPHRPVTRAASHFKSVLKAAKMAASRKMRLVKRSEHGAIRKDKGHEKVKKLPDRKKSVSPDKKNNEEKKVSNSSLGSTHSNEAHVKTEQFPCEGDIPTVVQCPTYYPSEEQFKDPILYIQSIQEEAEQYGMCKIVPPPTWKMESRELEDFRFMTQVQYIHKFFHKWSPITEQLEFIKTLNKNNENEITHIPQIGGVEIDLVRLYELVQKYGGMKGTVGKEKKWMKIADTMKIPKQTDRVSKLYAAYCKYLLAYETLSDEETEKLMDSVKAERQKSIKEDNKTSPACEQSVYKGLQIASLCENRLRANKGKSQPLSSFHRAARNTQLLFGRENCIRPEDIEIDFWETVEKSDDHVTVQAASLDTSVYGSMFPVRRDNSYARHGWNLHNLVESKGSILHHLGLIAGITVPTLHIGMLFSTKCLSCNVHNLPTVQYLHQGPGLVWYAVPKQETDKLKSALRKLLPQHTREKGFITEQDSIMVPPFKLTERGVSLSRCVQSEREFVVVFSSSYYSNISLGYNLSESVQYGTQEWIPFGCQAAKDLSMNYDVELFSMDAMLIFLARESTTPSNTLSILLPYLEKLVDREITERKKLYDAGLKETERLHDKLNKPPQKTEVLEEIIICDNSNKICYLSMVLNTHENSAFSLEQGLQHIQKRRNLKNCKLMYRYSEEELKALVKDVKQRLKTGTSSSPSGTSPKRKPIRKSDSKISP